MGNNDRPKVSVLPLAMFAPAPKDWRKSTRQGFDLYQSPEGLIVSGAIWKAEASSELVRVVSPSRKNWWPEIDEVLFVLALWGLDEFDLRIDAVQSQYGYGFRCASPSSAQRIGANMVRQIVAVEHRLVAKPPEQKYAPTGAVEEYLETPAPEGWFRLRVPDGGTIYQRRADGVGASISLGIREDGHKWAHLSISTPKGAASDETLYEVTRLFLPQVTAPLHFSAPRRGIPVPVRHIDVCLEGDFPPPPGLSTIE